LQVCTSRKYEKRAIQKKTISKNKLNRGKMPKLKTKSSAKKRFKVTGSGKLKRKHAFKSHILTKKSKKRKLKLTHDGLVHKSDEANIKQQLNLK
jgi:large subunit ribosomal protein L35